jgi:hypothetical protein
MNQSAAITCQSSRFLIYCHGRGQQPHGRIVASPDEWRLAQLPPTAQSTFRCRVASIRPNKRRGAHDMNGYAPAFSAIRKRSRRSAEDSAYNWKAPGANPRGRLAGHPCKSSFLSWLQRINRCLAFDCSRFCSCQILQIQHSWVPRSGKCSSTLLI